MSFMSGNKEKEGSKNSQEIADIPPTLSDLHCFTETEGVITTSQFGSPLYHSHPHPRPRLSLSSPFLSDTNQD